jgi:hypothetical protein
MKRLMIGILTAVVCIGFLAINGKGQNRTEEQAAEVDQNVISNVVHPTVGDATISTFLNNSSTVITKGFSELGTVSTDDGSMVRVLLVDVKSSMNDAPVNGISVQVTRQNGRRIESYVDAAKLDELIAAIDTIRKMDKTATTLNNFEGRYRVAGGLEVANIDRGGGRVGEIRAVQVIPWSGEIVWARALMRAARLEEFRRLVAAGKDKIADMQPKK